MALSFPSLDLMNALSIERVRFFPQFNHEFSGLGSGALVVKEFVDTLWMAEFTTAPLYHAETIQAEAIINAMRGSLSTFYAWNPRLPYPQSDPKGTLLLAGGYADDQAIASIASNRKEITLNGLPPNFVLTRGDFIAATHGDARGFYQVVTATVAASGAGVTPTFEIAPHLLNAAAVADPANIVKPAAEMRIIPGSFDPGPSQGLVSMLQFRAIQHIPV